MDVIERPEAPAAAWSAPGLVPAAVPPRKAPSWTWAAATTWLGLAVVLIAAAVLSFAALRDLAIAVRIHADLAWLLPIAVDAGAAVSCSAWLSTRTPRDAARFARSLTWGLLVLTVAGNAGAQGMAAADIEPAWWVAVLVGAIPPAVVGGVVHLAVLVGRAATPTGDTVAPPSPTVGAEAGDDRAGPGDDSNEWATGAAYDDYSLSRLWETAPAATTPPPPAPTPPGDRAGELIAEGAGRRRLARELDITEHEARALLATHRNGVPA